MRIRPILLVAVAGMLLATACDTETPITPKQVHAYAAKWKATVEPTLTARTEGASIQKALQKLVDDAAAKEKAKTQRDEPPYAVFVRDVYAEEKYQPKLVEHGKLTPAGKAAWEQIQHVEDHALDPGPYAADAIGSVLDELQKATKGLDTESMKPDDGDVAWAEKYLAGKTHESFPIDSKEGYEKLTDALLASDRGDRYQSVMKDYEALGKRISGRSAKAEFLLASAITRFSGEVGNRHVRKPFVYPREDDYFNDPEIRRTITPKRKDADWAHFHAGWVWRNASHVADAMSHETKILHDRIRASLRQLLTAEKPKSVVHAMWPDHPQYAKLVKEYVRYRKIADAGGWKKVPRKRGLDPGDTSDTVRALGVRLKAEGYYPADQTPTDTYDDTLKQAITDYQKAHQMKVTGEPHLVFWRSLNVPAERRAEQIAINLRRMRYTNVRASRDGYYAYIDIPDFSAEIWDHGKRKMHFGIVVGNNDLVEDEETGKKIHKNRTPVPIAAYIDRAIYNPYWNVTPRIRENEILPEVKEYVKARYYRRLKKLRHDKSYYSLDNVAVDGGGASPTPTPAADDGKTTLTDVAAPSPDPANAANAASDQQASSDADGKKKPAEDAVPEGPLDVSGLTPEDLAGFPYLDPKTGVVDVSTTDPDHIPGWYAENKYEVMYPGKKWEYVRMLPGEENALGKVKVIFPNLHDVYLHDTNAKALFSRHIRAFSHGCMRMSKPLQFAETLLRRDGLYEKNHIPRVLKEGTYRPVFLKRKVPVFVEYYTVRVGDDGRANFLADVYDYDEKPIIRLRPSMNKAEL